LDALLNKKDANIEKLENNAAEKEYEKLKHDEKTSKALLDNLNLPDIDPNEEAKFVEPPDEIVRNAEDETKRQKRLDMRNNFEEILKSL
jgi:hypothetical protein